MARIPSLRRHKPTSQAVVTLSGHDYYLGVWPPTRKTVPPEIQAAYERLIAEWLAGGRLPLNGRRAAAVPSNPIPVPVGIEPEVTPTVADVLAAYWDHAECYYRRPDGSPSPELHCLRSALRPLRLYDDLPADNFSPLKLKAVREIMIRAGLTRKTINRNVGRVKRVFKWAVENELVRPVVSHGLQAVGGLKAARSEARESARVCPVPQELVEKTLPHLPPTVAAMVRVQMLTGMRSGEVCRVRPCDIDRSSDVWTYRPAEHKTAYCGKERLVSIGPRAQAALAPFLERAGAADFVFSPARAEADRRAKLAADRKTKRWPSHMKRNQGNRKTRPSRPPGNRYTRTSYGCCVTRACERAFSLPPDLARGWAEDDAGRKKRETKAQWRARLGENKWAEVEKWRDEYHWHPHQLRHLRATEVRRLFGLDAAQVVLGHAQADVTQVYAEVSTEKAAEVARRTG